MENPDRAVIRTLVAALPEARYHVRYVKVTGLSKRDLCLRAARSHPVESLRYE